MIAQYIQLGNKGWNILVYYGVEEDNFIEIKDSLKQIDCPKDMLYDALSVLKRKNTGFTFTNTDYKMSVVCIADTTTREQLVNTAVHEAHHVQNHICEYYDIDKNSETAAYLIGYIV